MAFSVREPCWALIRLILHAIHEANRNVLRRRVSASYLFSIAGREKVDVNVHPSGRSRCATFTRSLCTTFTRDSIRQAISCARPIPCFRRRQQVLRGGKSADWASASCGRQGRDMQGTGPRAR